MASTITIRCDKVRWDVPVEDIDGINERCIELPLGIETAELNRAGWVLDAGCALLPAIASKPNKLAQLARVVHLTQAIDSEQVAARSPLVSCVSADFRDLSLFADRAFDRTVCLSSLEHVGLDNRQYGGTAERCPETARDALRELWRVTRSTLLLSVPFTCGPEWNNGKWRYFTHETLATLLHILPSLPRMAIRYYHAEGNRWSGGSANPDPRIGGGEKVRQIVVVRLTR